MTTTISIIIPCYNSEKTIFNTIASVISCSSKSIEIIVVDDGSIDSTKSVVESIKDQRIRYFYKKNEGYSFAVNYGVQKSKGKYVLFLGSDDILINNVIENLLDEVDRRGSDIIAFSALINNLENGKIYNDSTTYISEYFFYKGNVKDLETINKHLVEALFRRDTCKLFKRSAISNNIHFGKYGICSDEMFSMSVSYHASSFSFIPVVGYSITLHYDSVSHDLNSIKKLKDILDCFILFEKKLRKMSSYTIPIATKDYWKKYEKYLIMYSIHSLSLKYYFYRNNYLTFLKTISGINPSTKYRIITFFPKTYHLYTKIRKFL